MSHQIERGAVIGRVGEEVVQDSGLLVRTEFGEDGDGGIGDSSCSC